MGTFSLSLGPRVLMRTGDLGLARVSRPELLDGISWTEAEIRVNFRDIERVNAGLGGSWLTTQAIADLIQSGNARQPLTLLDLGTGSADIPRAILRWARRQALPVDITATDRSMEILRQGQVESPHITYEVADACDLQYSAHAFEIVTCSLLLHHLSWADATRMLSEMSRVARVGIVLNDLVRNAPSYLLSLMLSRLATRNRLTRHDAPLSVRRAYTLSEILRLVLDSRLEPVSVHQAGFYRVGVAALSG